MALSDADVSALKAELGFNLLSVSAEPYIGVTRYFDQIVVPNLQAGATTSSSTAVSASSSGVVPVSLTLASATGFAALNVAVVDVDDLQEIATIQSVSGSAITLPLKLAHSGNYPVTVEGGEALVRRALVRCRKVAALITDFGPLAGVKQADKGDAVFFGGAGEKTGLRTLQDLQRHERRQLCLLVFGVGSLSEFGGGSARLAVY